MAKLEHPRAGCEGLAASAVLAKECEREKQGEGSDERRKEEGKAKGRREEGKAHGRRQWSNEGRNRKEGTRGEKGNEKEKKEMKKNKKERKTPKKNTLTLIRPIDTGRGPRSRKEGELMKRRRKGQ